ncbi:MAG: hypothetical protein A2086_02550 [Spirochaetes bacterium GWD1_27_9]|nr:MAG: hypothetical protein A2Z98_04875 [Spirochaetes bacterium GWB1_27_13]OHD23059.1 MAG: hypothetical protein A2Y34_17920 [Spirochaetes bacterium GWC1_27_15]OHD31623.1 MAG: hypothetical protein A2086_02550 [Spirochaetes bacterium GWD1_27_9]
MAKLTTFMLLFLNIFFINIYSLDNTDDYNVNKKKMLDYYDKQQDYLSLKYANIILKDFPDDVVALSTRSSIFFYKKKYDDSLLDINKALELLNKKDEKNQMPIKNYIRETLLRQRGVIYDLKRNYEEAITDFLEIVKMNNKNAIYQQDLAITYAKINKMDKAIDHLKIAIDIDPLNLIYYDNLIQFNSYYNLNIDKYISSALFLKRRGTIINKKIKNNIISQTEDEYNQIDGKELYYSIVFDLDGNIILPQFDKFIKIGDILKLKNFKTGFSEINGMVMLSTKYETNADTILTINAIKLLTFYEVNEIKEIYFIFKVKVIL